MTSTDIKSDSPTNSLNLGQNFKYQVFSDSTEGISIVNASKTPTDKKHYLWERVNSMKESLVDSVQHKLSVQRTNQISDIFKRFQMFFSITGPILLFIMFILVLVYWKREQNELWKNQNQCYTKECLLASSFIVSHMNKSISPCENFFQYACGSYYEPFHPEQNAEQPVLQAHQSVASAFGQYDIRDYFKTGRSRRLLRFDRPMINHLTEINVHAIIHSLRNIYDNLYGQRNSAKFKVAEFYDSCASTTFRNWLGAHPLIKKIAPLMNGIWLLDRNASNETGANLVNETSTWPKSIFWDTYLTQQLHMAQNWSWMESIKHLQVQLNVATFADFLIYQSPIGKPQIYLTPDSGAKGYLSDYKIRTYVTGILEALAKDAGIPYGNEEYKERIRIFTNDLKLVTNELRKIYRSTTPSKWSQKAKLGDLNINGNAFDWSGLLSAYFDETYVVFDSDYPIYTRYLDYLQKFPILIGILERNFTKPVADRIMNNYMFWNVLSEYTWHLSYEYYMLHLSYHYNSEQIMELECFLLTHELFDTVLGAIYVEKHLHNETEKEVEQMTKYLKTSLKNHLKQIKWMDDQTREDVNERINKMKILFKVPEIMRNDKKLNYAYRTLKTSYNYLNNLFSSVQYIRGVYNRILSGVTETSEENWSSRDVMVYDSHVALHLMLDEVFIPPGMLQLPIFHHNLPAAFNFGGLGSLVGTAIGILVGEYGSVMLKEGEVKPLWTSETIRQYKVQKECVREQIYNASKFYFNFSDSLMSTMEDDMKKITRATINEASGLDIARSAYEDWINNSPGEKYLRHLPGVTFNPKQLFYLTYTQTFCHNMDIWDEYYRMTGTTPQPPYEVLVNHILNELPDFSNTFNCPIGTPMNPGKRCRAIL
uniref:Endothelin-converting enzyme 1 n=1 Tax=Schistosoma japonicum TaxID=6182 RepID=C1LD67_SCHJA|nr:Endothelin-converting enzyme 1 [Schistosoma japonicum]